ncbi:hypothetical protein [uncultured Nocardioides sp.]|uniref:LVIVD repeat-containing protein n=1 Tax=uncultured Nocardioides sp. TaxID=198441 RepID=UPI0030FBAD21
MSRPSLRARASYAVLGAVLVGGVGLAAVNGSAQADPGPRACTPAEREALVAAGDNFALACELPGSLLADMRESAAAPGLSEDDVDKSDNVELVAHLPLVGAFAEEGAFGTDMAFQGRYAYVGNYNGFGVYDIKRPTSPRRVAQVVCPGGQGDISVHGDVLVLSVDSSRSDDSCTSTAQSASEKSSWEGLRVFDISQPAKPRYVASVETACGSHTHTLAPNRNGKQLFVYVSSYSPSADFPDCQPPHDIISVVKVPVRKPARARLVATPVLFPDGGNPGGPIPLLTSSKTSGCHDVTAYPAKDLAAGACMGDGILMDISKRAKPTVIDRVTDDVNFAFWHSATFNDAGTKVLFTDELGGGSLPTCSPVFGPTRGADGIYDIESDELAFKSYYKIPRVQTLTENCVAHNGSLIPVKGKDIMVQAWYQGGFSVFDFTDSANPEEIAWFDRGPISATSPETGGAWSVYWYNGHIYSSDITRGLEVFAIDDPRVNQAKKVRTRTFNAQSQPAMRR